MEEPEQYAMDERGMIWQRRGDKWFSPVAPQGASWEMAESRFQFQNVTVTPETPVWENVWGIPNKADPWEAHLMVSRTQTFCGDIVPSTSPLRRRPHAVPGVQCICVICLVEWMTNPEYPRNLG